MTELIDISGLTELAETLRSATGSLDQSRIDAMANFAALGHWSDRATVDALLSSAFDGGSGVAASLETRASTMASAEARQWSTEPSDYDRFYFGPGDLGQIQHALDSLDELLSTDGKKILWFSDGDTSVSDTEMRMAMEILLDLPGHLLRSVLAQLDPALLRRFLVELDDHDLDARQRDRVYEHLATHATGTQLGTMVVAADGDSRDRLIEAAALHASAGRQAWAFTTVLDAIEDDVSPHVAIRLFGAFDPAVRELALHRLDRTGRLDDGVATLIVDETDIRPTSTFGTLITHRNLDASALADFIDLVAAIESHDLKAAVFVASVDALADPLAEASALLDAGLLVSRTTRFDDDSGTAVLGELAELLQSDPLRIFDALRLDTDLRGEATSAYFRELLREPGARPSIQGEPLSQAGAVQLNAILVALLGPDPDDRAAFFQATDPAVGGLDDYVNAARLGYFAGALSAGLQDLGAKEESEWETVGLVLGGIGLLDPTKTTSVLGFGVSVVTEITDDIQDRTVAELQDEYGDLEDLIVETIVPRETGYRFDGDAADEFENEYKAIANAP